MSKKIIIFLIINMFLLSGCTKLSNKMGLNFDKRFAYTKNEAKISQPPFLKNDYALYISDEDND